MFCFIGKPAKYGINVKCLNDASFPFCYRCEPFAGNLSKNNETCCQISSNIGKPEVTEGARYYEPTTHGLTIRLLSLFGWSKLAGTNLTVGIVYLFIY